MIPSASRLLAWYDTNRRSLPWRAEPGQAADPYHVWLSEIMLQQTTVAAVLPYYAAFLARFPTLRHLADAPLDDVLASWAGLGYYSRARNLHACAKRVAPTGFPADAAALRALPGIGAYTATAIAAIAFGIPGVPIDGNVIRVAARIAAIEQPLPAARPAIEAAARTLGAQPDAIARPSDFAQALFDLGATVCTPRPACMACPWSGSCQAYAKNIAANLPRKAAKRARPVRHAAHFWLQDAHDRVLLRRRPPTGLLGGMAELPGTPWRADPWPTAEAHAYAPAPAAWQHAGHVVHVFTHFELRIDVFAATTPAIDPRDGFLASIAELPAQALPSVMRKCIAAVRGTPLRAAA